MSVGSLPSMSADNSRREGEGNAGPDESRENEDHVMTDAHSEAAVYSEAGATKSMLSSIRDISRL
jgi:hypothetical protein